MRPNNADEQKRLLCVEDGKGMVVALCRLLRLLFYRVLTARDGEEELRVALSERLYPKRSLTVVRSVIFALLLASVTTVGWADDRKPDQGRPDDLTELSPEELIDMDVVLRNVLGTHIHLAGEWMIGYKYMFMGMGGNRDGTNRKSENDVLQDFMVAPINMSMEMQMINVMYGVTDNLTLMAMFPDKRLSMDHVNRMGARFTTESKGIGDVEVMGHYAFYERDPHRFIFLPSLRLPTGSINEKGNTPAGPDQKLPYPMQLGSGTFALKSGITYVGQTEKWAWGAHTMARIGLGKNSNHYRLGNRYYLNSWGVYGWADWLSSSVQIDGKIWGNIHGADPDLNPRMVPTADPDRRGGKRIDLLLGLSYYVPKGTLKGFRFSIVGGLPLYQSLDGPQLETDWRLSNIGWQWTF